MVVVRAAIVKDAPVAFAIASRGITIVFVSFYPSRVSEKFLLPTHAGKADGAAAVGTAGAFICGSFMRFSIRIDRDQKRVASIRFQTNGCGFMIAAAETVAETIEGRFLSELHGLNDEKLLRSVTEHLGEFEPGRIHCRDTCFEAIHAAFSDYRSQQLEEFQGEKALICTCFGVSEETIERIIKVDAARSVETVGEVCGAGAGCGSCRMLIQEMIDQGDGQ